MWIKINKTPIDTKSILKITKVVDVSFPVFLETQRGCPAEEEIMLGREIFNYEDGEGEPNFPLHVYVKDGAEEAAEMEVLRNKLYRKEITKEDYRKHSREIDAKYSSISKERVANGVVYLFAICYYLDSLHDGKSLRTIYSKEYFTEKEASDSLNALLTQLNEIEKQDLINIEI